MLLTLSARLFFVVGGHPVNCGFISRIPGLYPIEASSAPLQVVTTKICPQTLLIVPLGTNYPQWRSNPLLDLPKDFTSIMNLIIARFHGMFETKGRNLLYNKAPYDPGNIGSVVFIPHSYAMVL